MKLLVVKWDEMNSGSYYIDKDKWSAAHERKDSYIYNNYCGTYQFNKATKKVTVDTGVIVRPVSVLEWHIEEVEE